MADEQETPAERGHRLALEGVVKGVGSALVDAMREEGLTGVGFAVMLMDYGAGGNIAYFSSVNRDDFIKLLGEMQQKLRRQ